MNVKDLLNTIIPAIFIKEFQTLAQLIKLLKFRFEKGVPVLLHFHHLHQGEMGGGEDT